MVIVNWKESALSLVTWGRIGKPWGAGAFSVGWSECGEDTAVFGVYQRRKGKKRKIMSKQLYNLSPDPKTPRQLESRAYVKRIIQTYHNLTEEELDILQHSANAYRLHAQHMYLKYCQQEKPSYAGMLSAGFSTYGGLTVLD